MPPEHRDHAAVAVDAGRAAAHRLDQPGAGALDLALAGLAAQLPDDLGDLREAGRAERVAAGEQAAGRVDRLGAADRRFARRGGARGAARVRQPERLDGDELADREGVVDLEHVDVGGADAGGA